MTTVIVHVVDGDSHHAMTFAEVDLTIESPRLDTFEPWGAATLSEMGQRVYTITGSNGYVQTDGPSAAVALAKAISCEAERTTAMRKERDEAIRERNEARYELIRMKEGVRRAVDPPEPEPDEDDPDDCSCCDYGEED